jgi:hypothetical protein
VVLVPPQIVRGNESKQQLVGCRCTE